MIEFFVPGKPVPMARPRVTRTGHAYTPKNCADYKSLVAAFARDVMRGKELYDGEVWVEIGFFFPMPKSWSKKKQNKMFGEGITSRPDMDNLYKAVTDAMNGIVYRDDAQITFSLMRKRYTDSRDSGGVLISVGRKEDFPEDWQ